jgi:hypothetical protein
MDIKYIKTHKFGIVALLFLILLVSQEKTLNFLTHTILGRLYLIILLLGVSCLNIILGIIAVLFIIIMINKDDTFYLEAFNPEDLTNKEESTLQKIKDKIKSNKTQQDTISSTSVSAVTNATTESFRGSREGFNMNDRERTMQLGKKSNEISISSTSQNTDNVEPSDKDTLSSTPSLL